MIKQGIKNYFVNLKYFFTPLGTIALGVVFGLSVLIPDTYASASHLAESVKTILNGSSIDLSQLQDYVTAAVRSLDWNEPIAALQTMLSGDWLINTLNGCIDALIESSEIYTVPIAAATTTFINELLAYLFVFLFFTILGIIGGYLLIKWLIRRNIARRAAWKYFLISLIDSLLTATIVSLCAWLISVWKPSIFISSVVSVILFGCIALFEAYIVHAWKKTDVKNIINAKNIGMLFATNLIILFIASALVGVAVLLTNTIAGLFIGIALMETAFIVIELNAEAYVKSFISETL